MTSAPQPQPQLTAPSIEDGKLLAAFLKDAGYNTDAMRGGFSSLSHFEYRKYLLPREPPFSALDTIVRWFTCELPVPETQARSTVPPRVLEILESHGVLRREGDALHPLVKISPFDNFFIASDPVAKFERGEASDLILWPNITTSHVMNAALKHPGASILDLGCGTGVLSVACAPEAGSLTATDLNPRAAEFTRFNARLNGVESVECLTGNVFEPVRGRKFDLIICNPPFYVLPSSGLLYSDNPMELDGFVRFLMRSAPEYLNESGYFQMLCEWVELEGQPWRDRLREWAEGLPCDVSVLRTLTIEPAEYGKERCMERPGGPAACEAAFVQWVDHYREEGVQHIHAGIVTLRRRTGRNWMRIDGDGVPTLGRTVAEYVRGVFAKRDLTAGGDEKLLDTKFRLAEKARLRHVLERRDQGWADASLALTMGAGPEHDMPLTREVADFLGGFDGTLTLRELIANLSKKADVEPETVSKECLVLLRRLLDREFVTASELE